MYMFPIPEFNYSAITPSWPKQLSTFQGLWVILLWRRSWCWNKAALCTEGTT